MNMHELQHLCFDFFRACHDSEVNEVALQRR